LLATALFQLGRQPEAAEVIARVEAECPNIPAVKELRRLIDGR